MMTLANDFIARFIGSWSLVTWTSTSPDGQTQYPFGEDAVGYLFYTGVIRCQFVFSRVIQCRFFFSQRVIRCRCFFSGKNDELLLRKSGPGLAAWRDNPPDPHEAPGVHCLRGGVLPWCRIRFHGTDIGAP